MAPFASWVLARKDGKSFPDWRRQIRAQLEARDERDAIRTRFLVHSPPSIYSTTPMTRPAERLLALLFALHQRALL
jgi:hypothetical protein